MWEVISFTNTRWASFYLIAFHNFLFNGNKLECRPYCNDDRRRPLLYLNFEECDIFISSIKKYALAKRLFEFTAPVSEVYKFGV